MTDQNHLKKCYQSYAFLCQERYAEATLICLRSVERNQSSLLSEINPCLFIKTAKDLQKVHRRCSSFPDSQLKKIYEEKTYKFCRPKQDISDSYLLTYSSKIKNIRGKLKPWHSMPTLQVSGFKIDQSEDNSKSKTTPTTPVHSKKIEKLSPGIIKVCWKIIYYY